MAFSALSCRIIAHLKSDVHLVELLGGGGGWSTKVLMEHYFYQQVVVTRGIGRLGLHMDVRITATGS